MNLENFNSEMRKRLDDLKTEKRGIGRAIINYIEENDWYCFRMYGSESNLHECEKALWQGLLESFLGGESDDEIE